MKRKLWRKKSISWFSRERFWLWVRLRFMTTWYKVIRLFLDSKSNGNQFSALKNWNSHKQFVLLWRFIAHKHSQLPFILSVCAFQIYFVWIFYCFHCISSIAQEALSVYTKHYKKLNAWNIFSGCIMST